MIKSSQRKNGFEYIKVNESDYCYIFEQIISPSKFQYEVFIKKVIRPRTFKDRTITAREVLPADEDFGKIAFSVRTQSLAKDRMALLDDMCRQSKKTIPIIC